MGTKKHGSKKEALPHESSKKEPQRLTWKSKYEQICATHVTNGTEENETKEEDETKSNALDGLSGYLSSDSSSGESELNEEVQNFLKEVDVLYEEDKKQQLASEAIALAQAQAQAHALNKASSSDVIMQQYDQSAAPTVAWQECYDSSTGYTYYWNMETNEVTWDMPPEYQTYMEALKQWQQYQAQGVAALLQARVQQQIQQQHQMLLQHAQEQQKTATKLEAAKAQQTGQKNKKKSEKKSDSEDERIELITSYGPFSEEESSDTDKKTSKATKAKKRKTEDKEPNSKPMGPQLPKNKIRRINRPLQLLKSSLVPYHPEGESDADDHKENSKPTPVPDSGPPDAENNLPEICSPVDPVVEIKKDEAESASVKVDDEDENALLDRLKSQTQVLKELGGEIPEEVKSIIVESTEKEEIKSEDSKVRSSLTDECRNLKLKLSARAKKLINISSATAKARATDFIQTPDGLKPIQKKKDEGETESLSDVNDLASSKKKLTKLGMPTTLVNASPLLSSDGGKSAEVRPREEGSRGGFGFVASNEDKKRIKAEKINFVKADILHLSEEDNKGVDLQDDDVEESNVDVKDLSAVLQDKMKFLSDSKEPVPPVQIWTIQLETLLSAWESKNLKKSYLVDWLNNTRKELETLEGTVAPEGWKCEWQREEKRYRYVKTSTGEVSWEFPAVPTASGGGEEEMDLSTTPPPLPSTPPPPQISVPSPPTPPTISAATVAPEPIEEVPPLPADVPPLPPLPPPEPPSPPPPPPQSPPPHHSTQPLPPGVDPAELPPLPSVSADFSTHITPVYPQFFQPPYPPQPQPSQQPLQLPSPPAGVDPALPPVPPTAKHDLSSELDNFYSDLATLEPEELPLPPAEPPPPPPPVTIPSVDTVDKEKNKKKKKTKLAPGLSLKKKGVSSLVAKWQQVQEDVRRDMKHD